MFNGTLYFQDFSVHHLSSLKKENKRIIKSISIRNHEKMLPLLSLSDPCAPLFKTNTKKGIRKSSANFKIESLYGIARMFWNNPPVSCRKLMKNGKVVDQKLTPSV